MYQTFITPEYTKPPPRKFLTSSIDRSIDRPPRLIIITPSTSARTRRNPRAHARVVSPHERSHASRVRVLHCDSLRAAAPGVPTMTDPSRDPEASLFPSGDQASAVIRAAWNISRAWFACVGVAPPSTPRSCTKIRRDASADATTQGRVGEHARRTISALCRVKDFLSSSSRRDVRPSGASETRSARTAPSARPKNTKAPSAETETHSAF